MTTNERTQELKKMMNAGFEAENNYSAIKWASVRWWWKRPRVQCELLAAQAIRNLHERLEKGFDEYYIIQEMKGTMVTSYQLRTWEENEKIIEIEIIPQLDETECEIRMEYWQGFADEDLNDESTQNAFELVEEYVNQELEQ